MSKITFFLQQNLSVTPAVVGYLQKDDTILLGLRKKVSFGLGEQLIAGIGGKLEQHETNEDALGREISEEIRVTISSFERLGSITYLFPDKPKWNQKVTVFSVTDWSGRPVETEEIKPLWFKKNDLPKNKMWPDNLHTIPMVLARKRFNGVFLYKEDGTIDEYVLEEL